MNALIEFKEVCKYYHMGDTTVVAADHISFQIYQGEFVAIVGHLYEHHRVPGCPL